MRSCSISRPRLIAEAIRRRAQLAARTDLNAYRLLHGDAEGAPGLAVDRFGDVVVVHVNSYDTFDHWRDVLRQDLADAGSAYVKVHPSRARGSPEPASGTASRQGRPRRTAQLSSTAPAPELSALEALASSAARPRVLRGLAPGAPVWGLARDEVDVVENGIHYVVRPAAGLSVGLFLDMRAVRAWVRHSAAGRSVLNTFAYTCAFGVSATVGHAQRVVNLDLSRPYLAWGQDNYRLNDLACDPRDFIYGDAFDWLARFSRRATRFDMVIVDPPSFSSTPFSVTRDYPKLVHAAAQVVAPAGILIAATNHAGTSDKRFGGWLRAGLESAGRHAEVVQRWHEPQPDFPVAPGRSPYLKVRALVLD